VQEALALARAEPLSEKSPLGQRILARASETPEDAEYVFAEVVEDIRNPQPASLDLAAVELESTIQTSADNAAAFFPGYPASQPGFYGGFSYAPQMQQPNYLSNMRYAAAPSSSSSSMSSGSSSGSPFPGAGGAYAQFGIPYSAYPPIPPPMPTYLPPPPFIPLATPGGGAAAAAASASA